MIDEAPITRKAIRQAAAERLAAAGTIAGSRVFGFRVLPVPDDKLPALLVYTDQDNGDNTSAGSPVFRRSIDLVIECVLAGTSDDGLGDALDDFAEAATYALLGDPAWTSQFEKVKSVRVEFAAVIDGARRIACAKVTISIQFSAEYPPPADSADDLSTVGLSLDTLPTDGRVELAAVIDLSPPEAP